jgi:hypothetical protein
MTKLHSWRVKEQDLSVTPELMLEARVGEGFEILELGIDGVTVDSMLECVVGEENILTGVNNSSIDDCFPVPLLSTNQNPLYTTIRKFYTAVPTIKVASGEKLILTNTANVGKAFIFYVHYTLGQEPAKTVAGGSESLDRLQLFNAKNVKTIDAGATEIVTIDTNLNGKGFAKWVYPDKVPAGVDYNLLGISISKGAGADPQITVNSIRLWKAGKSILSPEELFSNARLYPYNNGAGTKRMFLFPEMIKFVTGEDCKIEVQVTNTDETASHTSDVRATLYVHQTPIA